MEETTKLRSGVAKVRGAAARDRGNFVVMSGFPKESSPVKIVAAYISLAVEMLRSRPENTERRLAWRRWSHF